MADATGRPQWMRYSFEARCRAVALMRAGRGATRPGGASRASGYRWWASFQAEGWVGLPDRRSTPHRQPRRLSAAAEATTLAARERRGAGPLMLGPCSGGPPRPSAGCGGSWGVRAVPACRGRWSDATSAPSRVSGCPWTPRSWAAAGLSASASAATASGAARGPAGSTGTSPSTTMHGWPTPRCGPPTTRRTPWLSWTARCPDSAPRASRCRP